MSVDLGFPRHACGEQHSASFTAPDYWTPALADDPDSVRTRA